MPRGRSNAAPLVIAGVVVAVVAAIGGAVVGLLLVGGGAPSITGVEGAPPAPPPELPLLAEPASADTAASRPRQHVGAAAPALTGGERSQAEAFVLGKDDFLAGYRAAFAREAGRAPSTQQEEDAAWGRARRTISGVPASYGAGDGRLDADNCREIEIGERDDIMTFLSDRDRRSDLRALRNDPAALTRLFAHRVIGPQTDGPTRLRARTDLVDDGTTLTFGPGAHALSWAALGERGHQAPRDVTIQGAGIDATLIRLSDFSTDDVLWNLHIRDCTIDCGNDGAFDLRSEQASVLAERVRFVRFDAGHGGCYILACNRGAAFYAKACVFAGGYGRSPGNGSLLRSVNLARFEDCTFERIKYPVLGGHNSVDAAAFVRCLFRDCPRDIAALESEARSGIPPQIVVEDCTTEWTLPEESRDGRRGALARSLTTLFPGAK